MTTSEARLAAAAVEWSLEDGALLSLLRKSLDDEQYSSPTYKLRVPLYRLREFLRWGDNLSILARSSQDHGGEAEKIGEPRSGRMAWHLKQAEARATAAEARAAKVVEMLKGLQWAGTDDDEALGYQPCCPVCSGSQGSHDSDCALATLLSDHPAPEPGVEAGEVRRATLEEAAKVADTYEGRLRCSSAWNETMTAQEGYDAGVADASIYIAKDIRALADGGRDGK